MVVKGNQSRAAIRIYSFSRTITDARTRESLHAGRVREKTGSDKVSSHSDIFAHGCRGAEKALLEISSLQSELITQLSLQASVTDRLYDDALVTTESVEKGNKQLVQAKKRQKSTIKFVFIFLMTMTLLLLFLDSWY
jgi:ABC-type Na+ efflux pump permease subunit